jgi:hypothetical protein
MEGGKKIKLKYFPSVEGRNVAIKLEPTQEVSGKHSHCVEPNARHGSGDTDSPKVQSAQIILDHRWINALKNVSHVRRIFALLFVRQVEKMGV